jgi:hypothetical protein
MAETTADVRRDIELTRDRMSSTLAELEQMAIARGEAGQPPYPALDAAVARASALAEAQAARSATLEAALTAP